MPSPQRRAHSPDRQPLTSDDDHNDYRPRRRGSRAVGLGRRDDADDSGAQELARDAKPQRPKKKKQLCFAGDHQDVSDDGTTATDVRPSVLMQSFRSDGDTMSAAAPNDRNGPREYFYVVEKNQKAGGGGGGGGDGSDSGDDETDADGAESAAPSSLDDSMGGSTTARSKISSSGGTSTGCTLCGKHFKIPFTVLTFMAMSVPIVMLPITALIPMATAAQDLVTVDGFNGLAAEVSNCVSAMSLEDYRVFDAVYHPSGSTRQAYTDARAETDEMCDVRLLTELRSIAIKHTEFDANRDTMARAIRQLNIQRSLMLETLDAGNYTLARERIETMRVELEDIIFRATNTIARVAAVVKSETSRYFVDLNLVGITRAKLWFAAATGSAYLSVTNATKAEIIAFTGNAATAESASKSVEAATSPAVAELVARWHRLPETLAMWEVMRGVMYRGASASFDKTHFNDVMQRPLAELRAIEATIVEYIAEARASRNAVLSNGILLGVGLLLSAIAATLLAHQQIKVQGVLRTQMERVEKTKRAVAAFVPRFFLNKMGYTSITHVTAGDSREVALTMIFSDIRAFTTVAEGMTNRALFDWVQGFFKLMTTIIEGHHGNINQFIGDALFALFSTANDGVVCAVEMQAKTQQLNLQRLCVEGIKVPLDIGVGIHHDVLSLGILGDERRHTCTALSASVNLASRLEGLTKQLGCRVLATEAVVDQLSPQIRGETAMRKLGVAQMKGSLAATPIYDVFQADERAPQDYKTATLKAFERFAKLSMRPDAKISQNDREDIAHLRHQLAEAAEQHSVRDPCPAVMETVRDPKTGKLLFDE